MKYFKVLLPFLAICNGQEDGEEEHRQCVNCEEASVLIVGGEAPNGNNYAADGIGIEKFRKVYHNLEQVKSLKDMNFSATFSLKNMNSERLHQTGSRFKMISYSPMNLTMSFVQVFIHKLLNILKMPIPLVTKL